MIATFSSGDEMFSVLSDSTNASLQLLTDPQDNSVRSFLKSISENAGMFRGHPAAVSLHFSGSLIPLFILSGGSGLTDSTASVRNFLAYADSAGLSSRFLNPGTASEGSGLFKESLILVSKSRTIINSAVRHISDGTSVLESEDLVSLVQEKAIYLRRWVLSPLLLMVLWMMNHCSAGVSGQVMERYLGMDEKMQQENWL